MIFSQEEHIARHQFHKLFCSKYLYVDTKTGALNEEPWNATILSDILHAMYPDNPLTPEDIETIIELGGMRNEHNELFFKLHQDNVLAKPVIVAISPYISTRAYVQCMQTLNGHEIDTVAKFLTRCCNDNSRAARIPSIDLYDSYTKWCMLNNFATISKRAFLHRLRTLGFPQQKGYVNKKSGVSYIAIGLNEEAVNSYVRPEELYEEDEDEEGEFEELGAPGEDSDRPGDGIPEETVSIREESLPAEEASGDSADSDPEYETDYWWDETDSTAGDRPADEDGGVGEDPEDRNAGSGRDEGGRGTFERDFPEATGRVEHDGSPRDFGKEDVLSLVRKLPIDVRQLFKALKVTYRIAPDHFARDEFDREVKAVAGLLPAEQLDNLYMLFVAYAK